MVGVEHYYGQDLLRRLAKVKAVATDVDGTLTENRQSYRLHLDAIKAIRMLEEHNIPVILVSGNAVPLLMALSRYLGTSGPVIGENGCVIGYSGKIEKLCRSSAKDVKELILRVLGDKLSESWQNMYRSCDLAFHPKIRDLEYQKQLVKEVSSILRKHNYNYIVVTSGFAIHVKPNECDKGLGVRMAAKILGISAEDIVSVGDGSNDIELLTATGISAAVSNADPELKEYADIVLSKPSGQGFAELAKLIIYAKNNYLK